MHSMDMSVQEQLRSMQRCFQSKLDIISDKLDAVVATMSHRDISIRCALSGLLATSEDIHKRQVPCVTLATLPDKAL